MPALTVEEPRPLCPVGPATFRLAEVTQKMQKSFDGSGEVPRLIWKFVSNRVAPTGEFYEVSVWTGLAYGNQKARLTWLLDLVSPGMTAEKAKKLNTDLFVGQDFEAAVKHGASEKDGTPFATFLYLRPVGTPIDPFVDADPGATVTCETCANELTDMEAIACTKRWGDGHRFCREHAKAFIAYEQSQAELLFAEV
jgi:hypothetical protein